MLSFFDDGLVGDEDAAVQLRGEIGDELLTALQISIDEEVLEVVKEGLFE